MLTVLNKVGYCQFSNKIISYIWLDDIWSYKKNIEYIVLWMKTLCKVLQSNSNMFWNAWVLITNSTSYPSALYEFFIFTFYPCVIVHLYIMPMSSINRNQYHNMLIYILQGCPIDHRPSCILLFLFAIYFVKGHIYFLYTLSTIWLVKYMKNIEP